MLWNRNKLFCDINPTCYKISLQKEIAKRHIQNMLSKEKFAGKISNEKLPNLVSEHHSHLIKRGKGIDPVLQENKANDKRTGMSVESGWYFQPLSCTIRER